MMSTLMAGLDLKGLKAQFDRDGYVLTPGLAQNHLELLRWSADGLAAGTTAAVWTGPWAGGEPTATLVAGHFNPKTEWAWQCIVANLDVLQCARAFLNTPEVQLDQATLVTKPPQSGQAFPLHQDAAFYDVHDGRYVIAMVYLDTVTSDNGSIRFLSGSHRVGELPHVQDPQARKKHLPLDQYRIADTVEPQGQAGDVVWFSGWTVHGSYPNRSHAVRRTARFGFRPRAVWETSA